MALVGGDVELEGGNLRAESGRIELGSVASPSLVNLTQTDSGFALGYAGVQNFGDIKLSQKASVDTSGAGGGSIQVQGRRLSLRDGSSILSITSGSNPGGNFTVNATEKVELIGQSIEESVDRRYASSLSSEVQGAGSSGEMQITTGKLITTDGAYAQNFNFSSGQAGNLIVKASDIDLAGSGLYRSGLYTGTGSTGNSGNLTISAEKLSVRDGATLFTKTSGDGNAGNLTINTRELLVRDGAEVTTTTLGAGRGGDFTVNATEKVEISGFVTFANGQIFSSNLTTGTTATGNAGNLTINTPVVLVKDGGFVSTSTYGAGNAGDLTIKTGTLQVQDGGAVTTVTGGAGKGGNLTVNATEKVEISGFRTSAKGDIFPSNLTTGTVATENAGDLTINTKQLLVRDGAFVTTLTGGGGKGGNLTVNATEKVEISGFRTSAKGDIFPSNLTTGTVGSGTAGSLKIDTQQLIVQDRGQVLVGRTGTGNAGNLEINARSIRLDNQGLLSAQSTSGNGGNITLQVGDLLLLRHQSTISATAGTAQQPGNGGNITIDAPNGFIVAVPLENSDITANAYSGQGGNVSIRAANIFNIAPLSRQQLERLDPNDLNPYNLRTNDITAISQQNPNLSGQVNINTPNVDPSRTLTELPAVVVDTSMIVDSTCVAFAGKPGNQFTITGRGGLPPSPNEPLTTDVVWLDTRLPITTAQQHREETPTAKPTSQPEAVAIVPATGWVFNGKGQVTLISSASHANSLKSSAASCPQR